MRDRIREALSVYQALDYESNEPLTPAAVLVLVYEHDGGLHVVFQKRTDRVDTHKGQISFPGGAADDGDPDLGVTALRETWEEIGVHPHDVELLGRLDQMRTISGFLVTPYVGWLQRYPYEWVFSEHEVDYLLEVPLGHLLDDANFVPDRRVTGSGEVVMPAYRFGDDLIWGATARMLQNFLDLVIALEAAGGRAG